LCSPPDSDALAALQAQVHQHLAARPDRALKYSSPVCGSLQEQRPVARLEQVRHPWRMRYITSPMSSDDGERLPISLSTASSSTESLQLAEQSRACIRRV